MTDNNDQWPNTPGAGGTTPPGGAGGHPVPDPQQTQLGATAGQWAQPQAPADDQWAQQTQLGATGGQWAQQPPQPQGAPDDQWAQQTQLGATGGQWPQQPQGATGGQWPQQPQPGDQWAAPQQPYGSTGGQWPTQTGGYAQQGFPQQGFAQQGFPQQPQHPGQPYGQQPMPQWGQQPPRNGNRTGLIIAVVLVVVALVGGGIAAVALTRGSDDDTVATATTTTTTPGSSAPKTTAPSTKSTTAGASPGAKGVVVPSLGIVYDVPNGWNIAQASDTSQQAGPTGAAIGFGKSYDAPYYCPGSAYRTLAFVVKSDVADPAAAATKVAKIAAESGYSDSSNRQLSSPTDVTTTSGITGKMVEGSGPWQPTQAGCTANAYTVYSFAFKGPQDVTLVLAIEADRNATGELTPDQAKQIIQSVRKI